MKERKKACFEHLCQALFLFFLHTVTSTSSFLCDRTWISRFGQKNEKPCWGSTFGFGRVNWQFAFKFFQFISDGPTVCVGPEFCYLRDSAVNAPQRLFVTFLVANIHSAHNNCMGLGLSWDVRKTEQLSSSGLGSAIMLSVSQVWTEKCCPSWTLMYDGEPFTERCGLEQLISFPQTPTDNLSYYLNIFRQTSTLNLNKRGYGNFRTILLINLTLVISHSWLLTHEGPILLTYVVIADLCTAVLHFDVFQCCMSPFWWLMTPKF